MARKVEWYTVLSAKSVAITFPDKTVKMMPRGAKFKASHWDVHILLRNRSIRKLSGREIPQEPAKKSQEVKES